MLHIKLVNNVMVRLTIVLGNNNDDNNDDKGDDDVIQN